MCATELKRIELSSIAAKMASEESLRTLPLNIMYVIRHHEHSMSTYKEYKLNIIYLLLFFLILVLHVVEIVKCTCDVLVSVGFHTILITWW